MGKQSVWLSFQRDSANTHRLWVSVCRVSLVKLWFVAASHWSLSPLCQLTSFFIQQRKEHLCLLAQTSVHACLCFQQECRARKNFSSLYAVVSALKSNPIHRLRRTWHDTDRCVRSRIGQVSQIKERENEDRTVLNQMFFFGPRHLETELSLKSTSHSLHVICLKSL